MFDSNNCFSRAVLCPKRKTRCSEGKNFTDNKRYFKFKYIIVQLNMEILLKSFEIELKELHDKLIVTTALIHNTPLITNDKEIKKQEL